MNRYEHEERIAEYQRRITVLRAQAAEIRERMTAEELEIMRHRFNPKGGEQ